MKRLLSSLCIAATAACAWAETGIISSTPEGTLYPAMYGGSNYSYLISQGGFGAFSMNYGYATQIVVDDADIYIHNVIREYPGMDSWIKGRIGEDGKAVFKLPQPVATDSRTGETLYASMIKPVQSGNATDLVTDTENPDLVMEWDGEKLIQICPGTAPQDLKRFDGLIGLTDEAGTFRSYGDQGVSYYNWDVTAATPPAGIEISTYTASYTDEWNESHKLAVNMGVANGEAWIQGLCEAIPEAWIKGYTDENGEISLFSQQFLGIANGYFYFFYAAQEGQGTGDAYSWLSQTTLSPTAAGYEASGAMMMNLGATRPWFGIGITGLSLTKKDASDPIPVNPYFGDPEWSDTEGMGIADFHIAPEDINGQALDKANLYYRIFFDGELADVAFDEEGNPIRDIPFGKNFDMIMYEYDWHFVIFLEPLQSIGVQAVYKADGNEYCSDIVTYEFKTSGVSDVTDKEIADVKYFTMTGAPVSNPTGICIRKVTYTDGTTVTTKEIVR